jgi:hypothetical protein
LTALAQITKRSQSAYQGEGPCRSSDIQIAGTKASSPKALKRQCNQRLSETNRHLSKQFETATEQTKELSTLAQNIASETAEPIKKGITRARKKVA